MKLVEPQGLQFAAASNGGVWVGTDDVTCCLSFYYEILYEVDIWTLKFI